MPPQDTQLCSPLPPELRRSIGAQSQVANEAAAFPSIACLCDVENLIKQEPPEDRELGSIRCGFL